MNCVDVWIASKVTLVEGQNSFDAVDAHCRRQSRVVHLHTGNVVSYQQSAPFLVDRRAVRQSGSARHLGAVLIETFARETLGWKTRQTVRTLCHGGKQGMEIANGEIGGACKSKSHCLLQNTRRRPFERHPLGTGFRSESLSQFRIEFHLDGHGFSPPRNSLLCPDNAANSAIKGRSTCYITTKDEAMYSARLQRDPCLNLRGNAGVPPCNVSPPSH